MSSLKRFLLELLYRFSPKQYVALMFRHHLALRWDNLGSSRLEAELLLLADFLKPDSVFFDIGANIGEYTLMASRITTPDNIYAFEPIPALNRRLRHLFPQCRVSDLAISDKNGQFQFKIPVIDGKMIYTRSTLNTDYRETGELHSEIIPVTTSRLDDVVRQQQVSRLDLIKIDVEGHEEQVFEGALQTIAQFRPVMIIEIAQVHHRNPISQIIRHFEQAGRFKCHYFNHNTNTLTPLDTDPAELQNNARPVYNFIFIPE